MQNLNCSDLYVVNILLRVYAVCGHIEDAQKVFDQSPQLDLVSWTTLIQAYVSMGYWKEGVEAFFRMCERKMIADERTIVVVLSTCAKLGDLSLGKKIHEYMCDHEVNFDVFVGNALLDTYLKCGDADFTRKVFNRMPLKNVVSWNSTIIELTQQGEFKEALNVFQRMQREGVKPDDYTLVGVLNSCAYLGVLEVGTWVHEYVNRNCIKADGFIGNALIDMYAKCGSIDEAFKVFNDMKGKDVYTTEDSWGLGMLGLRGSTEDEFEMYMGWPAQLKKLLSSLR
ncbi:hypothetical protein RJ639_029066 [Escallonia herrerae]|uniref:Pentatricopeptide repeat-containing protein n=1 Tax=Escallonia herrerae TaxID=1293975 RepID=A0AA88X6P5_9ASTE|nr:hypothetical protein RJ639_029066 [Escallonia herrerae]